MKIGITMNDELVKRMDNYAENNYMTRSGLIAFALNQYLNSMEITHAVQELALAMRKIADTGSIDEETTKKLEDFERFSNLLLGK